MRHHHRARPQGQVARRRWRRISTSARSTFDRWLEANEDFREAWELADTHSQAFWEEIGFGGVGNKFFNDRAWSLQVRNRFPHSYKESRELELSGAGGAPIQIVMTPADAKL